MNSVELGKIVKSQHPGEYDEFPDEAVGLVWAKKYLGKIQIPEPPTSDALFPGLAAKRAEKRLAHIRGQEALQTDALTHKPRMMTAAVTAAHGLVNAVQNLQDLPSQLADQEESRRVTHQTLMVEMDARQDFIHEASRRGLDPATLGLVRLEEEKVTTEIAKADGFAEVEVKKQRALKEVELDGRMQEIQMDVQAALTVALADKHKLLHVQDQVLKLIERSHQIQIGPEPEAVKTAKLEVMGEVIAGLRQELRGLLQGNSQKGLQGGDSDSES